MVGWFYEWKYIPLVLTPWLLWFPTHFIRVSPFGERGTHIRPLWGSFEGCLIGVTVAPLDWWVGCELFRLDRLDPWPGRQGHGAEGQAVAAEGRGQGPLKSRWFCSGLCGLVCFGGNLFGVGLKGHQKEPAFFRGLLL